MKYGLSDEDVQKIILVIEQYEEVTDVILYGSRALGTYKKGSDIDLCLKGQTSTLLLLNIRMKLEDLNLPYEFDVSLYERLDNPALRDHIDRVGIRLAHSVE